MSLDDFGSDYSSFLYFKHLPLDKVKIDKSFVKDIFSEEGYKNRAIIHAIFTMADKLNIDVICEGVETKEQYLYLFKNNISFVQGYYFSEPITWMDLEHNNLFRMRA